MSPIYVFSCDNCSYCQEYTLDVYSVQEKAKMYCDGCGKNTEHARVWTAPAIGQMYGAGFSPSRPSR